MRRRVALVSVLFVASACLLFPAVSDLGGGEDAALDAPGDVTNGGGDAAPDGDAGALDAGADAADAAPVDAGSDATSPFCAQHASALFCADFDESSDAAAGFSNTYVTEGGVVKRDTNEFSTSPASLLAGNTTLASGQSAHAAEVRITGFTPTSSLTLDLDLDIDALATQGTYIEAFAIVFNAATRSSIQLNVKTASTEVGEELVYPDGGQTYVAHTLPAPLATGKWVHVIVALDFSGRTITTTVDGTVVIDHVTMLAGFALGPVDFYVGNAFSPGPSSGASIHYDDVLAVAN